MIRLWLFVVLILGCLPSMAVAIGVSDFKSEFEIKLDDELPTWEDLEKIFLEENRYYDKKYHTIWELTGGFDRDFYARAATYGINEKRLKWENEEQILEMLALLPKEMYPYIGPMLFLIPNMSEKILNMPGIRETKNKFPERIADELKDIEDIEFLSPFLYVLLMPEAWNMKNNTDQPQMTPYYPKIVYDPEFYAAIKKLVPPENFMPGAKIKESLRSRLRTVTPDANSLLTGADVEAFANTISAVDDWYRKNEQKYNVLSAMMWANEVARQPAVLAGVRELVNPCGRLVQKAKIMGKEIELARIVVKEGFTLNEWAYTCDKTVKAYRVSQISSSMMQSIRLYKKGIYEDEIDKLSPKSQAIRYATIQAIISANSAPMNDVIEVRKKRSILDEKWKPIDYRVGNTSIRIDS